MQPNKRRHQKEPPSEQSPQTGTSSPSPKRHQPGQDTTEISDSTPFLLPEQRRATIGSSESSNLPRPQVTQPTSSTTEETSSNMVSTPGQEPRSDEDGRTPTRRSTRLAGFGSRGRRGHGSTHDNRATIIGSGTTSPFTASQDSQVERSWPPATVASHMDFSDLSDHASSAGATDGVEGLSLDDGALWGGLSDAEMRRQISMLNAMERRRDIETSPSTGPQSTATSRQTTPVLTDGGTPSPGTPSSAFQAPSQTINPRHSTLLELSSHRTIPQHPSHTYMPWRTAAAQHNPASQLFGDPIPSPGSGSSGTSHPGLGHTRANPIANSATNPATASGNLNPVTLGRHRGTISTPLDPFANYVPSTRLDTSQSGFERNPHSATGYPVTTNASSFVRERESFEDFRRRLTASHPGVSPFRPEASSSRPSLVIGSHINPSRNVHDAGSSSDSNVPRLHPSPFFSSTSMERSYSDPLVQTAISATPVSDLASHLERAGPSSSIPLGAQNPGAHSSSSHSKSRKTSSYDQTFRYSASKGCYEANVPAAYWMYNPNTKPLSTTDPFFKTYTSDPDVVPLGRGRAICRREPTPEIRLDETPEDEKETKRQIKKAQRKQDWTKRKSQELGRSWQAKYSGRRLEPYSSYPDEMYDEMDEMDDLDFQQYLDLTRGEIATRDQPPRDSFSHPANRGHLEAMRRRFEEIEAEGREPTSRELEEIVNSRADLIHAEIQRGTQTDGSKEKKKEKKQKKNKETQDE